MGLFRRLGLSIATTIFSTFLVVFALSLSAYFVLDKPVTIKNALRDSGAYSVIVDNTLSQKQQELNKYLPVEQPEVQTAIRQAFSTTYLQQTTEHNIDATYDWIHGVTDKPHYSADLSQPKQALASSIGQVVNKKLSGLPACTKVTEVPTTLSDILNLECRPIGFSTDFLTAASQSTVESSSLFDRVVAPVLTFQDEQGKSLTSSLSVVPKVYHYFVISLFVVPVILLLSGVAIIFWSESRRLGVKYIARALLVTGIITILLSLAAVWGLSKAAQWMAGSSSDLILVEGKIVDVARIVGAQLRNWLMGIGGGYIVASIILGITLHLRGRHNTHENMELNTSLGYNNNIPGAGTTFGPGRASAPDDHPAGTHEVQADAPKQPTSDEKEKSGSHLSH